MRFRMVRIIQLVLLVLLVILYIGGDLYKAAAPIGHNPWLFPLGEVLCAAAMILIDRKNKCPHCKKDLGYTHKERCPHCGELL